MVEIFEFEGTHYCIVESTKDMVPISAAFSGRSYEDKRRALFQVMNILKTMHENEVYHGNLKTANILANKNGTGEIKVVTKCTAFSSLNQRDYAVNSYSLPSWVTPEIIEERVDVGPAAKDDVWALGGLAHELFSTCRNQRTPFSSLEQL